MEIKLFIAVIICMVCSLVSLTISYFVLMYGYEEDKNIGIISAILFSVFTALILLIV